MFQRIHRDESGFAMVFAVLVVFVVVTLSITVLSLSIHNSEQSAYDRRRVTSVVAAEAGVDDAWNRIQTTAPENLPCTTQTGSVEAEPGPATFSAAYSWYADSAGTTLLTGCPSQTNVPAGVLVTATGRTSNTVPRQVQAYMTLTPNYGGFDAAILSVTNTTFSNNFTVTGLTGNDGDVYITSGNLVVTNSPTVYGNVYVPTGSASMSNGSQIVGNLWALNSVTVNNPATVTGNVISSTSSIAGSGTIGGSATAGTTIAAPLTVGGNEYPSTPQGPPPTQAFPKLCQVAITRVCSAMPWTGYTVTTYTGASACTSAKNFLTTGTLTGNRVVFIDAVCNLAIGNNDDITFTGDLAIVTQGMHHDDQPEQLHRREREEAVPHRELPVDLHGELQLLVQHIDREQLELHQCQRPVLLALHGDPEQLEQLRGAGPRQHREHHQPVHAELPAGPGAGGSYADGLRPGDRVPARGRVGERPPRRLR